MSALAIIQAQLDTERAQNSEQALALAHAQAEITALKAELAAWQDAWQEKSPYIGSSEFLAPAIAGAAAEAEGLALALALAPVPPAPPIGLGGSVYHVESPRRLWCQSPKPEYDVGQFKVFNEADEKALLIKFFDHIRETKPCIFTTFNGDYFDWPFIQDRAEYYQLKIEEEIGIYNSTN